MTLNYSNLRAQVATRYPTANEKTLDRLCRSALHETAHLFISVVLGVRPYSLRIQRSGAGWINAHSHDEREILISLAGVAMEFNLSGNFTSLPPEAMGDVRDSEKSSRLLNAERPGIICGLICRDLMTIFCWRDVWGLLEDTATRVALTVRKSDGQLTAKKTCAVCNWLDTQLKKTGLGTELAPLRNRVIPAQQTPQLPTASAGSPAAEGRN